MEQLRLQASDLLYMVPELTLVVMTILLSVFDLLLPSKVDRRLLGWLALLGIVVSAVFVLFELNIDEPLVLLGQSYRIDDFANMMKLIFLTGAGLIVFMSIGSVKREEIPHVGEYYYLILPATLGAMIMASSADLITLFIGLELLSITSYILVGMRKSNKTSNEAAFKYIVMGGISSAFILYGMSFLYGMTGSTNLGVIKTVLSENYASFPELIYVSFFLMLAGFGFKIAAAPFHTWAPDVYQGASTPITAFLAVISKAAGLALIFRLVYNVFYGLGNPELPIHDDIFLSITILAAVSMVIGNILALKQRNVKRLLAYSGVANAGYLLVPIGTAFTYSSHSEFIFYMIAYLFMNVGAFAVLMVISQSVSPSGEHEELNGFAGLYYRAPFTAVAMVLLILSLSGIPVSGGFFGKLYIILGTLQIQLYWLAAVMIATSVISFYYYFGIVRQMFMRRTEISQDLKISYPLSITIWICASSSVLLGIFPHKVIAYIEEIFSLTRDFFV